MCLGLVVVRATLVFRTITYNRRTHMNGDSLEKFSPVFRNLVGFEIGPIQNDIKSKIFNSTNIKRRALQNLIPLHQCLS